MSFLDRFLLFFLSAILILAFLEWWLLRAREHRRALRRKALLREIFEA